MTDQPVPNFLQFLLWFCYCESDQRPGTTFTKPYFLGNLRMSPTSLSVNYHRLEKFATDKYSSLLNQFVSYDEIEVL